MGIRIDISAETPLSDDDRALIAVRYGAGFNSTDSARQAHLGRRESRPIDGLVN